jgi:hypothetical protein
MTKIVRFNLSGNTLFKNQPPRVIVENNGTCLEDYKTEEEEINAENYHYEHPTTLKDICVLLYMACGHGVMWQLSRELAERLHLDKKDILIAIENIIHEYFEMTEEQAIEKYDKYARYIKISDNMPDEIEEEK